MSLHNEMGIEEWIKGGWSEFERICKLYNWQSHRPYQYCKLNENGEVSDFDFWLIKNIKLNGSKYNYEILCQILVDHSGGVRGVEASCDLIVDSAVIATFELSKMGTVDRFLSEANMIVQNFFLALSSRV